MSRTARSVEISPSQPSGGLFWLAIMIALTLSDFMTRGWLPILR
jgi:hypothetical protein